MMRVRVHRPTVRGRLRADRGLLVLTGLVVALASALLAAVWPLTVRTADEAWPRPSARPARAPRWWRPCRSCPSAATAAATRTRSRGSRRTSRPPGTRSPTGSASVLRPSVASLISPSLSVSGPGPSRYLRLVYVQSPTEPPAVTWVAGGAPQSSAGPGEDSIVLSEEDPPWPVQVGLSERAAFALDLLPGARLTVEDQYGQARRRPRQRHLLPGRPGRPGVEVARELLSPAVGISDGVERTSVAALVSPESLPDLRIAVPSDELTERITFLPDPERVRWEQAPDLQQDVVELKAAPGLTSGEIGWDSVLDRCSTTRRPRSRTRGAGPRCSWSGCSSPRC